MKYLIKVKEYTTEIDITTVTDNSIYPMDIDFGGSLKIRVDEELRIINAMDGWGNNVAEEYKDEAVKVYFKLDENEKEVTK